MNDFDTFTNRKIDFAIIYSPIKNYDLELVNFFFQKLEKVLLHLKNKEYQKGFSINIDFPFSIYIVSSVSETLPKFEFSSFRIDYILANSLKEAVEKIHPTQEILKEGDFIDNGDTFLYFESIAPLLDVEESINLIYEHFQILADYTYCDIAVPGFLPIVISVNLSKRIYVSEKEFAWNWSELLLKNTQTLNLNIYYIEKDYRIYRLRFDLFNERYQKICKNLFQHSKFIRYRDLEEYFEKYPSLLRIAPSWIEIEITSELSFQPKIYPYKKNKNYLNLNQFQKVLLDLQEFGISHSMNLSFGGTGDPFLHSDFPKMIELAVSSSLFENIYIETFGDELDKYLDFLKQYSEVIVIVKIPSLREELYTDLMGKNILKKVKENLLKITNNLRVYAEILRIQQVEDELDSFFEFFKNTSVIPIIGKYNQYGNLLPDFRAVDLEPFEKDFCRNLMYSLFISSEGKIPICKQDIFCQYQTFSLEEVSLKEVFNQLLEYHTKFINKNYKEIIPICEVCKEWYVYLG